jgi:hypothetical protein
MTCSVFSVCHRNVVLCPVVIRAEETVKEKMLGASIFLLSVGGGQSVTDFNPIVAR